MNRVLLLLLTLWAFAVRLWWFARTPHPLGTDGYYYVVQVSDLVNDGALHVPDSSWVFWVSGAVASFADPVQATKIVASLLAALCVPAAFLCGKSMRSELTGWGLAAWAAASPTLTFLAADFPKNLSIAAPWLLLCALIHMQDRRRWVAFIITMALMATGHRMGAALAGLGALGWLVARRSPRLVLVAGTSALGFGLLSAISPGLLHWADAFRLDGQVAPGDGWPPFCWFPLRTFHWLEQVELVLVWPALALAMWSLWRGKGRDIVAVSIGFLVLTTAPIWRSDVLDIGYRLSLFAPLIAVPVLAALVPTPSVPRWAVAGAGVVLAPVAVVGATFTELPPYDHYQTLILNIPRPLPELLIAHQGINFFYDHTTGEEAMAWAPEPELERENVGRLAWGIRESEWVAYGASHTRVRLDGQYSYVREDEWEAFVQRARLEGDDDLQDRLSNWRNPSRVRPAALMRTR